MGVNEKLFVRMKRHPLPTDITMKEIDRFLRSKGFILQSRGSSHLNFKHNNLDYILTIVSHDMKEQVKAVYIENILIALEDIQKKED